MRAPVLLSLLFATVLIAPAHSVAASVVIYRCTDTFGALTVQNDVPCPKGSKQRKQVIQPPPPMPAYHPAAAPKKSALSELPAVATSAPQQPSALVEPQIADADRLPPPALYQCNTYDNDSYLSENATPEPRCVRLQTTDLQGSDDTSAGVACQMVTDQCQRIADGAACGAWKRRLRETEAAWKFGHAEEADANKVDYDRVQKIVRESTCGR